MALTPSRPFIMNMPPMSFLGTVAVLSDRNMVLSLKSAAHYIDAHINAQFVENCTILRRTDTLSNILLSLE